MEYFALLDAGYGTWGFDTDILDKGLSDSIGEKLAKAFLKRYQTL